MTEVAIVGAGPYGLSVAANLRKQGVPFRIFGRKMAMWTERMPRGMLLKSDGCATNLGAMPLTLERFCNRTGRPYGDVGYRIPIEDLIAYGRAFCDEYVGAVEELDVETIAPGFEIRLRSGEELRANRVVVATGLYYLERLPQIPGLDGVMTHSSAHHDLSKFAGQRVAVVGGGQSALETAALLHENGAERVTVLTRGPVCWFGPDAPRNLLNRLRHPYLGAGPGWFTWAWSTPGLYARLPQSYRLSHAYSTFGPGGTAWIQARLQGVPNVEFRVGAIARADRLGNGVRLNLHNGGRPVTVDHVIAGTGYVPDLRRLPFLAPLTDRIQCLAPGVPMLNARLETRVPGLHVVGYLSAGSQGPSMRFVYGTKLAGPMVASSYAPRNRRAGRKGSGDLVSQAAVARP